MRSVIVVIVVLCVAVAAYLLGRHGGQSAVLRSEGDKRGDVQRPGGASKVESTSASESKVLVADSSAGKSKGGDLDKRAKGTKEKSASALVSPEVTPQMVSEIASIMAEYHKGPKDDDSALRLLGRLACYKREAVLSAAATTMRFGSKAEKLDMVAAVGTLLGKDRSRYEPKEAAHVIQQGEIASGEKTSVAASDGTAAKQSPSQEGGAAQASSDSAEGAMQSASDDASGSNPVASLSSVLGSAMGDEDGEVRATAFDAMSNLNENEAVEVAASVLGGENTEAKLEMLTRLGEGEADGVGLRASAQAVDNSDASVRQQALKNLEQMTGQSFSSSAEVANWIEANEKNLLPSVEVTTQTDNQRGE